MKEACGEMDTSKSNHAFDWDETYRILKINQEGTKCPPKKFNLGAFFLTDVDKYRVYYPHSRLCQISPFKLPCIGALYTLDKTFFYLIVIMINYYDMIIILFTMPVQHDENMTNKIGQRETYYQHDPIGIQTHVTP